MAISVGSIIQFKTFGLIRAQQIMNSWHYAVQAISPGSVVTVPSDLAYGFATKWREQFQPILANSYTFDRVEVEEVNGVAIGSYAYPAGTTGTLVQEAFPPQDAVSIQLLRGDRTTRHGWKRIAGIPETAAAAGLLTTSYQTLVQNAIRPMIYPATVPPLVTVDLLDSEGEDIGTVDLRAIIWGGNSPSFPTGRYQVVQGFDVKPDITTQNTRKVGRGS